MDNSVRVMVERGKNKRTVACAFDWSGLDRSAKIEEDALRVLESYREFELVVSPALIGELERACAYPKLRKRIKPEEAHQVVEWLRSSATMATAPHDAPPIRSTDPGDDYLIALADAERAALVCGDQHLLGLAEDLPVFSPVDFLDLLEREGGSHEH